MPSLFRTFAALVLMGGAALANPTADTTIFTKSGEVPLQLEVVATPEARVQGLMNRDSLDPLDGMIFLFPKPHDYSFWMKDTRIPLDMLFIDASNKIVHIEADVPPYTKAERSSGKKIVTVIELDAGRANREGIAVGDHVRYALPPSVEIR